MTLGELFDTIGRLSLPRTTVVTVAASPNSTAKPLNEVMAGDGELCFYGIGETKQAPAPGGKRKKK